MTDRTRGNLYVTLQFVFLAELAFTPTGDSWPMFEGSGMVAVALEFVGAAILVIAFLNLGASLTAHPIPRESGSLKKAGLYAVVRHPIYLGLLLVSTGLAISGRSWWHVGTLVALSVLLHIKASFEERLLRRVYPDYAEYATRVGRLLPFLGRDKGSR